MAASLSGHGDIPFVSHIDDGEAESPVDPLAAKIIERSSIPTSIVLGEIENLKKGALGGHAGTEIRLE